MEEVVVAVSSSSSSSLQPQAVPHDAQKDSWMLVFQLQLPVLLQLSCLCSLFSQTSTAFLKASVFSELRFHCLETKYYTSKGFEIQHRNTPHVSSVLMFWMKLELIFFVIRTNLSLIHLTGHRRFNQVLLRWSWLVLRMWAAFGSGTQTDPTHMRVNTEFWLIWLLFWILGRTRWLCSRGPYSRAARSQLLLSVWNKSIELEDFCCLWANDLFSGDSMIIKHLICKMKGTPS